MEQSFFITGTDTNVGKTFISALLCLGLQAHYWKPIQTGLEMDRLTIKTMTDLPDHFFFEESYHLQSPLSPHAAAKLENVEIDLSTIQKPLVPRLIIEGAGGVAVPINPTHMMDDLILQLKIPALIVARSTLGTINHTLLTIRQLEKKQIPIYGIVLNGPKNPGNKEAIEYYGKHKVVAEVEFTKDLSPKNLQQIFHSEFNL